MTACEEIPESYQKQISNYCDLDKAINNRDAFYFDNAQKLIDAAIKKNNNFSSAEGAYNLLSDEAKEKINNYDKFEEMYSEFKSKPPVKILSYRVGENMIGTPEVYISAKNVSDQIIKEFTVMFFAWDKDGVPTKIDYRDYYQLLSYNDALKVNAKTSSSSYWTFYGMNDKSGIQQAVIIVRDVEFFDGSKWENPNFDTLCAKYEQQMLEKGDKNIISRG